MRLPQRENDPSVAELTALVLREAQHGCEFPADLTLRWCSRRGCLRSRRLRSRYQARGNASVSVGQPFAGLGNAERHDVASLQRSCAETVGKAIGQSRTRRERGEAERIAYAGTRAYDPITTCDCQSAPVGGTAELSTTAVADAAESLPDAASVSIAHLMHSSRRGRRR